jgi:hypothetical protein
MPGVTRFQTPPCPHFRDGEPAAPSSRLPWKAALALVACLFPHTPCHADEAGATGPAPDKRIYNAFHPTPRELMRPMATDRPDKTESPYTVDAGHFQIEMDVATFTHDRDRSGGGDTRTKGWAFAFANLKLGLTNDIDLQVILESFSHIRVDDRAAGSVTRQSGFGDVTTRLKVNLWGNDGGRTAFAIMPFLKFPSSQDGLGNNSVEGGVILPLAVGLPHGWSLGLQAEVDVLRNETDRGHHAAFLNTVTLGHDIVGNLAGYIEFFSEASTQRNTPWLATFDVGFTYAVNDDLQLDAGVNIGITKSAPDANPFIGISWRF